MKTKWMAILLLAGGALMAAPRVAIGVHIGAPAPVVVRDYRPPCPGPGYLWIDGYNDEYGYWVEGYWELPPYAGAYWVAPRYEGPRFFAGYWGGARGPAYLAPRRAPHVAPMPRMAPPPHAAPRAFERGYERGFERGHESRGPENRGPAPRGNESRGPASHGFRR
jgi:hypothetical protein